MLISDLDGPILDVSEKYFRVYYDLVTQIGGMPLSKTEYWNFKRNRVNDIQILTFSGIPERKLGEFREKRKALIETPHYSSLDTVWEEVRDHMSTSKFAGKIMLVTLRNNSSELNRQLKHLGISNWFSNILSSSGDASGPDRHFVKTNLIRGFLPEVFGGWFLGDTETDLRAGRALGLKTAAVSFGIRSPELIQKERPDRLLNHPRELCVFLAEIENEL